MKKNKSSRDLVRNLVRLTLILLLGLLVSFTLCKKEAKANDKILEQTVHDAFIFQSILLAHDIEPNSPNAYTDISALEEGTDDSFVSDAAIKTGTSPYYIRVNYGANCVTIYKKDDNGNYTKPYKAMICSSGKSTPKSGTYKITYKYRWLSLYGGVYGQYSTRIVKNILFHSVPYYQQRADTLEYDEYDKLGTTASAGCIRLTVRDAKWIYDNITSGTYVEFYSDTTNPGPLGKPTAQKISDNKDNRNWDPTDPDKNNPWNGGSGIPSVTYYPTENKTTTSKKQTDTTSNSTTNTSQSNTTSTSVTDVAPTVTPSTNTTNTTVTTTTPSQDKEPDNNSKPDKEPTQNTTTNTSSTNTQVEKEPTNTTTTQKEDTTPTTPTNTSTNTSSSTDTQIKETPKDTDSSSSTSDNSSDATSSEPEV